MSLLKTTTTLIIFCLFITTLAYAQTAEDYFSAGLAKANLKDYGGAIKDFNKVIEINPNYAAYYNRGLAKFHLKDNRGALPDVFRTKILELSRSSFINTLNIAVEKFDIQPCH